MICEGIKSNEVSILNDVAFHTWNIATILSLKYILENRHYISSLERKTLVQKKIYKILVGANANMSSHTSICLHFFRIDFNVLPLQWRFMKMTSLKYHPLVTNSMAISCRSCLSWSLKLNEYDGTSRKMHFFVTNKKIYFTTCRFPYFPEMVNYIFGG